MTMGVLHAYVPSQGDAWQYTLDSIGDYIEHVVTSGWVELPVALNRNGNLAALSEEELPQEAYETIGAYLQTAQLLGQRTAELHFVLSSGMSSAFLPIPFTQLYQRSLYQSMRSMANQTMQLLRKRLPSLDEDVREEARAVLNCQQEILATFRLITGRKLTGMRTRTHGDYHLGQVLHTGKDFIIIDFEGEPERALSERRIKRSPLRDVSGMLRSFQYAAHAALLAQLDRGIVRREDLPMIQTWVDAWHRWVSVAFLQGYRQTAEGAVFMPKSTEEFQILLRVYSLEKAVYEVGYELNNRPSWVRVPLKGIAYLLDVDA